MSDSQYDKPISDQPAEHYQEWADRLHAAGRTEIYGVPIDAEYLRRMKENPPIDSHCARCLKPAPAERDPEFIYWEALADADSAQMLGLICGDCITPEERQAMDEADA